MQLLEKVTVRLPFGLRLRGAAQLVQIANSYKCRIKVQSDEKRVDARSLLGLLSLAVQPGNELVFYFDGEDALEASLVVLKYLDGGSPEE